MALITFVSETTGKTRTLRKGTQLGGGTLGAVENLWDMYGESGLVSKSIQLNSGKQRHYRLMRAMNELRILRKAGMLEGYQRQGDTLYIIMKKIKGIPAHEWQHFEEVNVIQLYRALRKLHRKNIVHFDAHPANFIISQDGPLAHAIDFDMALDATYSLVALDTIKFFASIKLLNPSVGDHINFKNCLNYYVRDMIDHIAEHRYEACQQALLMGALTLAAIYGIPALAITHMMVREFIAALLWNQFGKEISGLLEMLTKSIMIMQNIPIIGQVGFDLLNDLATIINIINLSLTCYLSYSQVAYHLGRGGAVGVKALMSSIKDPAWQSIFASVTPEILTQTALLYYPIERLLTQFNKFTDTTLLSNTLLEKKADLLYKHHPKFYAMQSWDTVKKKVTGKREEFSRDYMSP